MSDVIVYSVLIITDVIEKNLKDFFYVEDLCNN